MSINTKIITHSEVTLQALDFLGFPDKISKLCQTILRRHIMRNGMRAGLFYAVFFAFLQILGQGIAVGQEVLNNDDVKLINMCIVDNTGRAKPEDIQLYCVCMNYKMPDHEVVSISKWEQTHAREQQECALKSGLVAPASNMPPGK
jgi:hypothetical protein